MATFVSNFIPAPGYAFYRSHASTISVPFQVRSTGRYCYDEGWHEPRAIRKPILNFYWCTSGVVHFHPEVPSVSDWHLRRDEVCFLLPGDRHNVSTVADGTDWWWMGLDGEWLPYLIESLAITRAPRPCGRCPVALFQRLAREIRGVGRQAEVAASQTAYSLLMTALFPNSAEEDSLTTTFMRLVEEHYTDVSLTLEKMAATLGVSRATLARIVTRECGMAPHEYLISVRMQHAMQMLQEGRPVKETAFAVGFAYQNYFSRIFARIYGLLPSHVRQVGNQLP